MSHIPPRLTVERGVGGHGTELPRLDERQDPNLRGPRRARRPPLPKLALSAILAPLVGGPLGAVAAIVFGWAARREVAGQSGRRGATTAAIGMALGFLTTVGWGAALALGVLSSSGARQTQAVEDEIELARRALEEKPKDEASSSGSRAAEEAVPKETTVHAHGQLAVVDVGASVTSLSQELAKQRAEATAAGKTLLVMTTRAGCEPCQGVAHSLEDPLMQTALKGVRLVRVDIDVFDEDLTALKMQHKRYPSFFLLALDLFPRDAIDGGEWDEDVPENMAPVLGAFVRGKYHARRKDFEPSPETGIRL